MAERKRLFSLQTERWHIIDQSNKIFSLADIRNRRQVKHGSFLARKIHQRSEVSEDHAARLVANAVSDSIRQGLPVLINDNTRLRVVYLSPAESAKSLEVMEISRFNRASDGKKIIKDPHFTGDFFESETGRIEFMLRVMGRRYGEKDGRRPDIVYHISSDGKYRPSAFSIVSPESILLARVDASGSLTCAWEYKGWSWYIKR